MPKITDPLKVKDFVFKNRIVLPPMHTGFCTENGMATQKLFEHYAKRCSHIGLCIVEHAYVSVQGRASKNQLGIHGDELIDGLKELPAAIKDKGAIAVAQINHAGSRTTSDACARQPVAPSAVRLPGGDELPRELGLQEIDNIIEDFAEAAARAQKAGFDGVEVHGAHGFLLNQFLSPITNKRTDKYGGSLENRLKLSLEIIKTVRSVIGPHMLLLYRLGADDRLPEGNTIKESIQAAKILANSDVDILDVSGGLCGSRPKDLQNTPGFFTYLSKAIKEEIYIPVIGVGGIKTKEEAEKVISEEEADLIAIGRTILKTPDWAAKNWS